MQRLFGCIKTILQNELFHLQNGYPILISVNELEIVCINLCIGETDFSLQRKKFEKLS